MISPRVESNDRTATGSMNSETTTGVAKRAATGDEIAAPLDRGDPQEPVTVNSRRVFQCRDFALFAIVTLLNLAAIAVCAGLWLSPDAWRQVPAGVRRIDAVTCVCGRHATGPAGGCCRS